VRFVVDEVALRQVFLRVVWFSLSVSLHESCLLIFISMLPFPEGQTGEAWKTSEINGFSEIEGGVVGCGNCVGLCFNFFLLQR